MKLLTVLRYSINLLFFSFILLVLSVHVLSFYEGQHELDIHFWEIQVFVLVYEVIILMALYYLRKFVLNAEKETPLDESTRKYLKLSGVFCLIFGLLDCYKIIGLYSYYSANVGDYNNLFYLGISACSSVFFATFIGLFFIYLSNVLAFSDEIRQENKFTI